MQRLGPNYKVRGITKGNYKGELQRGITKLGLKGMKGFRKISCSKTCCGYFGCMHTTPNTYWVYCVRETAGKVPDLSSLDLLISEFRDQRSEITHNHRVHGSVFVLADISVRSPVLPLQPKYRLGHPKNYFFSLSMKTFFGSRYQLNKKIKIENRSTGGHPEY